MANNTFEKATETFDKSQDQPSQSLMGSVNFENWQQASSQGNSNKAESFLPGLVLHQGGQECAGGDHGEEGKFGHADHAGHDSGPQSSDDNAGSPGQDTGSISGNASTSNEGTTANNAGTDGTPGSAGSTGGSESSLTNLLQSQDPVLNQIEANIGALQTELSVLQNELSQWETANIPQVPGATGSDGSAAGTPASSAPENTTGTPAQPAAGVGSDASPPGSVSPPSDGTTASGGGNQGVEVQPPPASTSGAGGAAGGDGSGSGAGAGTGGGASAETGISLSGSSPETSTPPAAGDTTANTPAATADSTSSTGVRYAGFATHWGENGAAYADPVTAVEQMHADGATMFRDNYSQGNTALDTAVETASNLGMTPQIIVANPEQATEAAQEYKGYNVQFETPNEPNTAYDQNASDWATNAASTAASYATESAQIANNIHAIDPTAKVDVGSVSIAGVGWAPGDTFTTDLVQDLKNNGTLGDFNAISIHPYSGEGLGAAGTAADIANLHQEINTIAGQPLQLDISEVGSTDQASTYLPQLETDLSQQANIGMFDTYQWAGGATNNDAAFQIQGTPAEAALASANATFTAAPLADGSQP